MKKKKANIVKIQVPIREELRDIAEEKALDMGFGSVQEVIRLFVAGFVRGEYTIGFNPTPTKSSDKDSK